MFGLECSEHENWVEMYTQEVLKGLGVCFVVGLFVTESNKKKQGPD